MSIPAHPVANLFPMIGPVELDDLAADIRVNGLIEPVWLYDDPDLGVTVLDGRNRVAACVLAGVEPSTRMYEGDDPIGFAVSANVKRRHLSSGQLAAVACDVLPLYEAEAAARKAELARGNDNAIKREEPRLEETIEAGLPQSFDNAPPRRAPQARDRTDGQNLEKGNPIYQLKRSISRSREVRGERNQRYLRAIMIKAWNAYREGRTVGALSYRPGGANPERYPSPV